MLKKSLSSFLLILICFVISSNLYSSMYSGPVELYQPDGTIVQAFATGGKFGNSFYGRAYDKDDFTIIRDKETTYYCWAKQGADGWIESTGFPIHLYDPKTLDIKPGESDSPERIEEKRRERIRK